MAKNLVPSGPVYPVTRAALAGGLVGLGRVVDHTARLPVPGVAGHRGPASAVRGGRGARGPGDRGGPRSAGAAPAGPGAAEVGGVLRRAPLVAALVGALLAGCSG